VNGTGGETAFQAGGPLFGLLPPFVLNAVDPMRMLMG
jgi:hypothetical protein